MGQGNAFTVCTQSDRSSQRQINKDVIQGPVVRRPISANPGLNFNPDFFILFSKASSRIFFSFLFSSSNYQTVDKKD